MCFSWPWLPVIFFKKVSLQMDVCNIIEIVIFTIFSPDNSNVNPRPLSCMTPSISRRKNISPKQQLLDQNKLLLLNQLNEVLKEKKERIIRWIMDVTFCYAFNCILRIVFPDEINYSLDFYPRTSKQTI